MSLWGGACETEPSGTLEGLPCLKGYVTQMLTAGVLKGAEKPVTRTTAGVKWHFQNSYSGAPDIYHLRRCLSFHCPFVLGPCLLAIGEH